MTYFAPIYHVARADFLERVRRPSFRVVLVLSLLAGYFCVPAADAGYITVSVGEARGIYNSAWIGAAYSLMCSIFLSLVGFYLVRHTVQRDRDTRVSQVLGSTPLSGFQYLLGKTASNFAVLSAVVGVLLICAVATQFIRAEDTSINIIDLVAPSVIMALPFMLVIAALAVLFEVIPFLSGAGGNVAYYILWNLVLLLSILPAQAQQKDIAGGNDLPGVTRILEQMSVDAKTGLGEEHKGFSLGIRVIGKHEVPITFAWKGMHWTARLVMERLLWVGCAIGLVVIAAPIFSRVESGTVTRKRRKRKPDTPNERASVAHAKPSITLTPLFSRPTMSFLPLALAELRLAMRSVSKWWYVVLLGLVITSVVTPLTASRQFLYPATWIWPITIWSAMGTREARYQVDQLVFSAPDSLRYQFPALIAAGAIVALAAGSGMALRLLIAGDMSGLLALAVGALFVPSLAVTCGVWAGRPLLFEAIYVALWYTGPMNHVPLLDYTGASSATGLATTFVFALITVGLLVLAAAGRRRQMLQ